MVRYFKRERLGEPLKARNEFFIWFVEFSYKFHDLRTKRTCVMVYIGDVKITITI